MCILFNFMFEAGIVGVALLSLAVPQWRILTLCCLGFSVVVFASYLPVTEAAWSRAMVNGFEQGFLFFRD